MHNEVAVDICGLYSSILKDKRMSLVYIMLPKDSTCLVARPLQTIIVIDKGTDASMETSIILKWTQHSLSRWQLLNIAMNTMMYTMRDNHSKERKRRGSGEDNFQSQPVYVSSGSKHSKNRR